MVLRAGAQVYHVTPGICAMGNPRRVPTRGRRNVHIGHLPSPEKSEGSPASRLRASSILPEGQFFSVHVLMSSRVAEQVAERYYRLLCRAAIHARPPTFGGVRRKNLFPIAGGQARSSRLSPHISAIARGCPPPPLSLSHRSPTGPAKHPEREEC